MGRLNAHTELRAHWHTERGKRERALFGSGWAMDGPRGRGMVRMRVWRSEDHGRGVVGGPS